MTDHIVAMDVFTLRQAIPEFSDARHRVRAREAMWVRLTTGDGLEGWGEPCGVGRAGFGHFGDPPLRAIPAGARRGSVRDPLSVGEDVPAHRPAR